MDTPSVVKKVKIWHMLCFPFLLKNIVYVPQDRISLSLLCTCIFLTTF